MEARTERGRGRGVAAAVAARPFAKRFAVDWRAVLAAGPDWFWACVAHEVEARRLFPWIAVAYGIGIALAFAADGPLSIGPPLGLGIAWAVWAVLVRHRPVALGIALAACGIAFGFAASVLRMQVVDAPVLPRLTVSRLEGFVESVEERQAGGRLVIAMTKLDRIEENERPSRLRVTVRRLDGVSPGDYVAGTARLLPPPEAARPGGYDFARDAYFRGVGAVGSISGRLQVTEPPPVPRPFAVAASAALDRARNALTARIANSVGGQPGAVAAALVTGKRGLIEERTNDILRAAGVYHVVSISGLHMMLAAGLFFWLTRAALACSPQLALSWPIKKLAAVVGMAGATAYCLFSGSDVAAERSLLMILVMQGAVLFDRPALSVRNLALSALLVLTREPEALLGPSFQMSYAAVAGLITLAEWNRRRDMAPATDRLKRAFLWGTALVAGTVLTTLVATVATAPFSSFHFQNLQPYGVIGNAATLPLVSFIVMPCAVLGIVAYPFGLDRPVWWIMGVGVKAMLSLSAWVAGLGGSIVTVPSFGTAALGLLVCALLIGTLCISGLRRLALVPAALGLLAASMTPRPDLYVARDGSGAAIRGRDGKLVVVGRVPAFTAEQWLKADGDARRLTDPAVRAGSRCDAIGCTVPLPDGRVVSYLEDRRGFGEDCARAAVIVSRLSAPRGCGAQIVFDRTFLADHGASAARATTSGFDVTTARRPDEHRPWLAVSKTRGRTGASAGPAPRARLPPALADRDVPAADSPDADAEP